MANKVKPFYFYVEFVRDDVIEAIIDSIPFKTEDSKYWKNKNEKHTVIGCANTYIFTSDSDQGDCFTELRGHQVLRWIKTGEKFEEHDIEYKLDYSACNNMTNNSGDQYFFTKEQIAQRRKELGLN